MKLLRGGREEDRHDSNVELEVDRGFLNLEIGTLTVQKVNSAANAVADFISPREFPMHYQISRRNFVKTAAVVSAASLPVWSVEDSVQAAPRQLGPNDTPGIALIG